MKQYKVQFYSEVPADNAIDVDEIPWYIEAADEETAIKIAVQYLRDAVDWATSIRCRYERGNMDIRFYDDDSIMIEHDYNFRAIEAA